MPSLHIPAFHVDAFVLPGRTVSGNPAAVCLIDIDQCSSAGTAADKTKGALSDDTLQAIAAEFNLSETAFVFASSSGEGIVSSVESDSGSRACPSTGSNSIPLAFRTRRSFHLRWFTPTKEVPLCGHATLAAAHCLFEACGNENEAIEFQTLWGPLVVSRDGPGRKEGQGQTEPVVGDGQPVKTGQGGEEGGQLLTMRFPANPPAIALPPATAAVATQLARICLRATGGQAQGDSAVGVSGTDDNMSYLHSLHYNARTGKLIIRLEAPVPETATDRAEGINSSTAAGAGGGAGSSTQWKWEVDPARAVSLLRSLPTPAPHALLAVDQSACGQGERISGVCITVRGGLMPLIDGEGHVSFRAAVEPVAQGAVVKGDTTEAAPAGDEPQSCDAAPEVHFCSRYFSPWNGIDEDPVNGSSHTILGPYWAGEWIRATGMKEGACPDVADGASSPGEAVVHLVAEQVSRRGGRLHLSVPLSFVGTGDGLVTVGSVALPVPSQASVPGGTGVASTVSIAGRACTVWTGTLRAPVS